jgi:hypothetical protein
MNISKLLKKLGKVQGIVVLGQQAVELGKKVYRKARKLVTSVVKR